MQGAEFQLFIFYLYSYSASYKIYFLRVLVTLLSHQAYIFVKDRLLRVCYLVLELKFQTVIIFRYLIFKSFGFVFIWRTFTKPNQKKQLNVTHHENGTQVRVSCSYLLVMFVIHFRIDSAHGIRFPGGYQIRYIVLLWI